jgi:hypothetical protein
VEREFDRYYMRLQGSLRGTPANLISCGDEDPNLIEYAVRRTISRRDAWDIEEHDFEQLENTNSELVCYISKNHQT